MNPAREKLAYTRLHTPLMLFSCAESCSIRQSAYDSLYCRDCFYCIGADCLQITLNSHTVGWLGIRVVSVLDSGAVGPGSKTQPRRCRVTVTDKQPTGKSEGTQFNDSI